MAALSGALLVWTAGACGQTSPSQGDPAETASSDDQLADNLYLRPRPEEWLTKPGSGVRRVHVIVLPEDASVYVGGKQQRRRDGVIELVGNVDQKYKLRVVKRGQYLEEEVIIKESGASPSFLNLDAQKASSPGGPKGASSTPSDAGADAHAAPATPPAIRPLPGPPLPDDPNGAQR
jgi:hypothetical protein